MGCPSAKDPETAASPETTAPSEQSYEAISLLGDTLYTLPRCPIRYNVSTIRPFKWRSAIINKILRS